MYIHDYRLGTSYITPHDSWACVQPGDLVHYHLPLLASSLLGIGEIPILFLYPPLHVT